MTTETTDYVYGLLMEGRLDMMHLPSGAVAWLWQYDRPQQQIDTASRFAAIATSLDDKVIDAALLRADQNVLVLRMESGSRISVYPDGGLGANGDPIESTPESIHNFLSAFDAPEPEMGSVMVMPPDLDIPDDMGMMI